VTSTAGPLLALETSTRRPSVALALDGGVVAERALERERAHAGDLLPEAQALLEEHGLEPGDLASIAVGVGPGSFTGLRVGVATALGVERATGCAIVAVPSPAAAVLDRLEPDQRALVLGDARAGRVYMTSWVRGTDDERGLAPVLELRPPAAPRWEELLERIAALPGVDRIFVDEAFLARAAKHEAVRDWVARAQHEAAPDPSAAAVARLGLLAIEAGTTVEPAKLRPLYLTRFGE
jgi:tRNA threonylcarbamoyladenosine biosynthesis protein TsaB